MKAELSRLFRFGVTGFVVALVYVTGYTALYHTSLTPIAANFIAYGVAVSVQYVMQTLWTFQRPLIDGAQSLRFLATIGLGLIYSSVLASMIGPALGWKPWVAAGLVAVTLPILNYISFRLWVFRPEVCRKDA